MSIQARNALLDRLWRLLDGSAARPDAARDSLLSDLWAYQTARCPALADHARRRGLRPGAPVDVEDIPFVPTAAFRAGDLVTWDLDARAPERTFRSSGTTGSIPSVHHLLQVDPYRRAALRGLELARPELALAGRRRWLSLLPDREAWPASSLVEMYDLFLDGFDAHGGTHVARSDGMPDPDALSRALVEARREGRSVALLGATFSFVALLEGDPAADLRLPAGSVVVETGGTKGRTHEIARGELERLLGERLGCGREAIISEYGMCELGSQAWTRASSEGQPPCLQLPPWVRLRILDPDSGEEVGAGQSGMVCIADPVNVDSCAFVATSDLGHRIGQRGLVLHGRMRRADARGCSLLVPLADVPGTTHSAIRRPPGGRVPPDLDARIDALAGAWRDLGTGAEAGVGAGLEAVADDLGLSREQVRAALDVESARWSEGTLRRLAHAQLQRTHADDPTASAVASAFVIPASTVPFAGLESVTASLLCGVPTWVRPSSRNPTEISLFRALLACRAPEVAGLVEVIDPGDDAAVDRAAREAESIVVHGGAEVIRWCGARLGAGARLTSFGPRWSLACVDGAAGLDEASADGLARDVLLHDGLGCMSPVVVMSVGDQSVARACARRVGEALARACSPLPPHADIARRPAGAGLVDASAFELARGARGLERVDRWATASVLLAGEPTDAEPGLGWVPGVLRRAVLVVCVPPGTDPEAWLPSGGPPVSTLGLHAALQDTPTGMSLMEAARARGASRVCGLGEMQTPPPGWDHDGIPLLRPFLRP